MTTGYSSSPLVKKLGISPRYILKVINPPTYYFQLVQVPRNQFTAEKMKKKIDFIHCFVRTMKELKQQLPLLKSQLKPTGMLWISWYKKSSGIATDVTEDTIREYALKHGMVDIKVCAIDEIWSGLKLVIPVEERKF